MKESPIFSKTYDFLLWLVPATTKFSREHRFGLAGKVRDTAFRFQEDLIEAGLSQGKGRSRALARADVSLAKLRFYVRLCRDLTLLTPRQYQHAAQMETEIGRLLGGWRKQMGG